MNKTIGPYIRFIPKEDQEVIAKCMEIARGKEVHRGMLAFIPLDELMEGVRDEMTVRQQAQQNTKYHNLNISNYQNQFQQNIANQLYGNGGFAGQQLPTSVANLPGGGGWATPTPYIPQTARLRAYNALLIVRVEMIRDEERYGNVPVEPPDIVDNAEETKKVAVL